MILVELLVSFLKIGLFTFGGGYGMIPLIEQTVLRSGWLDEPTLYNMIAISESTPGPVAVNMATFIGSRTAGLPGSLTATLGVVLPSFVILLLIATVMRNFRQNRWVKAAMTGIKPMVAGMITATGLCVLVRTLVTDPMTAAARVDLKQLFIGTLLLAGTLLYTRALKRRFSPILLILFAAACGLAFYGV